MNDLIVLIPGVMGSRLRAADGSIIWDASWSILRRLLTSLGGSVRQLGLDHPDAVDGVEPAGLVAGITFVPGFFKIDGYDVLTRAIRQSFRFPNGDPSTGLIEFGYDWRRDNRRTAVLLKDCIDRRLPEWRRLTGNTAARVILVGHSMGGLVARHYLEFLGGWASCKALITLGTPYHGSLRALGYLANGYRLLSMDLTQAFRSLPSVYQLLPNYPVLQTNGRWAGVADGAFPSLNPALVQGGTAFLNDLEARIRQNRAEGVGHGYEFICGVGRTQPTFQSAVLEGGQVTVSEDLPPTVDVAYQGGDGVVPLYSAIPADLKGKAAPVRFASEFHASLPRSDKVLVDLVGVLAILQAPEFKPTRASLTPPGKEVHVRGLADCYLEGDPVAVSASVPGRQDWPPLAAEVYRESDVVPAVRRPMVRRGSWDEVVIEGLAQGLYRLTVTRDDVADALPDPATDVFAVLPRDPAGGSADTA